MTQNANSPAQARHDPFLGSGEMAGLMRSFDWAATTLGSTATWPHGLRSAVRMLLTSRYQMWMGWGRDLNFFYNDAYRPTLGLKHPRAISQPAAEVWKEIWADIGPLIEQVLLTGEATYNEGMLLLLERSGFPEETYHTFSYSPLFDDEGKIAGMFCVVVEETERILTERRLATLRELASAASNTISEDDLFRVVIEKLGANLRDLPFTLTYLFDENGETASRSAATGFAGEHPAAPLTLPIKDSVWPVTALLSNAPSVIVNVLPTIFGVLPSGAWKKAPEQALLVPIAQAGRERSAAGFFIVGLNPHRKGDQGLYDFITLLAGQIGSALAGVRAYEEERRRAEALAELDRAKTDFFSNVSHEFRTPLTLMLGPLEDALTGSPSPEKMTELVDLAHRNGIRLLRLVNSLLDFSRIEAGRARASFEPVELGRVSAEIASSFRSAVEKAGMVLNLRCNALPKPVYVDREMWEKILLNLLSNAFKFTFEGEITVAVQPSSTGLSALVEVRDTGIGIPEGELPRLFERFHRVSGTQGRSFEGSGIGLALVNELVKLHGGKISARSVLGAGTTFSIELPFGVGHLPAAQVREQTLTPAVDMARANQYLGEALRWLPDEPQTNDALGNFAETNTSVAHQGSGKHIVLADDNADMREYVRRLLIAQGYTVTVVADGTSAIAAARRESPHLILTDVMMPGIDGFGVLKSLREDPSTAAIPVILLSARAGEEAKIEGLDAGADDYLIKPFAARELLARVNANIKLAEVRRETTRTVMNSERQFLMTQERLSLALSTGRVAVFQWDINSDRLIIQGPLAEVFGLPLEDVESGLPLDKFFAAIDERDRERVSAAIAGSVDAGGSYEAEYRVHGTGKERTVLARGEVEKMSNGDRRMSGVVIDVTEERAAMRAVQESRSYLQNLLNSTGEGFYAVDREGATTVVNRAFLNILGFDREEDVLGRKLHDLIHHSHPDGSRYPNEECPIYCTAKSGRPAHVEGEFFFRRDGSRVPVEYRAHPIFRDGEAAGAICTFVDVTDRLAAQRAMEEQAHALKALNRSAAAVAGDLDLERLVQTITDAGVEVTGAQFGAFFYNVNDSNDEHYMLYALSGVPREAFEKFPMPRNTEIFAPTFNGEGVLRSDDITKDPRYGRNSPRKGMPEGHLPVRSYLAVPVKSRSGEVLGGLFFGHADLGKFSAQTEERVLGLAHQAAVAMDNVRLFASAQDEIAQRRRAERDLQALNSNLEGRVAAEVAERAKAEEALRQAQKMEAVGQLTGGVAHDFNNLLTVILGGLDTIRRSKPEDTARVSRAVEMARQAGQRAASLTGRLLAFSRRQPLEPKPIDLNVLVRDMTDLLHRTLGEQIELEGVLPPRLWTVEVDKNQLETAILNVALNARDAMPEGGKLTIETVNTALDESYVSKDAEVVPGQYVAIAVSDTGAGMSKDTLSHVFEPFFTTKDVGKGTGLGLSMVYGFVKQSGGHVTIYSEVGQGTTVKLYFPRFFGDASAAPVEAEKQIPRASGGETILVVEDNEDVRAYSGMVLRELGYIVLEAGDSDEGLAILKTDCRIDLLFTDVVLPGKTGRVLADLAAEIRPGLKVLFTTGYSRNAIVHQGRLDVGVQLISKPFTFEQLAVRVRDVLDRRTRGVDLT